MTGKPGVIIDCFGILSDAKIKEYLKLEKVWVEAISNGLRQTLNDKTTHQIHYSKYIELTNFSLDNRR